MSGRRTTIERLVTHVLAAGPERTARQDQVAVEEPLEIRVAGETLAVTMRTPGQDRELAVGFAFAEGIVTSAEELGSVTHCDRPGQAQTGNTIDMLPAPGCHLDPDPLDHASRTTITTSACGVCGRQSIDDLLSRCTPLDHSMQITSRALLDATAQLQGCQPGFQATGGTHAAMLLDAAGQPLASAEDVGRHNAVDKVVGRLVLDGRLVDAKLLVVSGRVSFEIIQKATVARVPFVVGVSAPTSLAVELADAMGITLAGFARGSSLNLYTHAERVSGPT